MCLAVALALGTPSLTAGAATKKTKASVANRCHTAKRNGKAVRVCPPKSKKKKKTVKAKAASLVPPDYTALTGLSQPTFGDVQRTVHELKVGDATRLHLEIVKPAGAKDLGVIVEASPYHGTLYDRTGARMIPPPGKDGTLVELPVAGGALYPDTAPIADDAISDP